MFPAALVTYPSYFVQEYLEFREGLRELSRRRRADTLQSDMPSAIAAPGSILTVAGVKRPAAVVDGGVRDAHTASLERRVAELQLQLGTATTAVAVVKKVVPTVKDSEIFHTDGGATLVVAAMHWDLAPAGKKICELTSCDSVCPSYHILKATHGLTPDQVKNGCGTRATCEAEGLHPSAQVHVAFVRSTSARMRRRRRRVRAAPSRRPSGRPVVAAAAAPGPAADVEAAGSARPSRLGRSRSPAR